MRIDGKEVEVGIRATNEGNYFFMNIGEVILGKDDLSGYIDQVYTLGPDNVLTYKLQSDTYRASIDSFEDVHSETIDSVDWNIEGEVNDLTGMTLQMPEGYDVITEGEMQRILHILAKIPPQ